MASFKIPWCLRADDGLKVPSKNLKLQPVPPCARCADQITSWPCMIIETKRHRVVVVNFNPQSGEGLCYELGLWDSSNKISKKNYIFLLSLEKCRRMAFLIRVWSFFILIADFNIHSINRRGIRPESERNILLLLFSTHKIYLYPLFFILNVWIRTKNSSRYWFLMVK
jgi:hypothetical protein